MQINFHASKGTWRIVSQACGWTHAMCIMRATARPIKLTKKANHMHTAQLYNTCSGCGYDGTLRWLKETERFSNRCARTQATTLTWFAYHNFTCVYVANMQIYLKSLLAFVHIAMRNTVSLNHITGSVRQDGDRNTSTDVSGRLIDKQINMQRMKCPGHKLEL